MPGDSVPKPPPSGKVLFSTAVCIGCEKDVRALVSVVSQDSLTDACTELSTEVIDGDLARASLCHNPHEVFLRFLLFLPSMAAYLPV
jgi:hypothetical protein